MGIPLHRLPISKKAKRQLEKVRRTRTAKASAVQRAEMILLAAERVSNAEIARRLRCRPQVVGKWRTRFAAEGVAGLEDRPRSGRPVTQTEREIKEGRDDRLWPAPPRAESLECPDARPALGPATRAGATHSAGPRSPSPPAADVYVQPRPAV